MLAAAKAPQIAGSPVSDDGRGLKLVSFSLYFKCQAVRPSAMTGVD